LKIRNDRVIFTDSHILVICRDKIVKKFGSLRVLFLTSLKIDKKQQQQQLKNQVKLWDV